ncbi:hypothetical protein TYRP_005281 [Tyrophagus putrescentiae]|nr:hypothetical protein TYRP_005281 [Tyrophagus putrescentiae]
MSSFHCHLLIITNIIIIIIIIIIISSISSLIQAGGGGGGDLEREALLVTAAGDPLNLDHLPLEQRVLLHHQQPPGAAVLLIRLVQPGFRRLLRIDQKLVEHLSVDRRVLLAQVQVVQGALHPVPQLLTKLVSLRLFFLSLFFLCFAVAAASSFHFYLRLLAAVVVGRIVGQVFGNVRSSRRRRRNRW